METGPSAALPTVAGVPVPQGMQHGAAGVADGMPIGGQGAHAMYNMHMMHQGGQQHVLAPPEVAYVEVDEISPAGWLCLIVGCFACPGLNLLGLCMRERRLVPISQIQY